MHPRPSTATTLALSMTPVGPFTVAIESDGTRIGFIHSAGAVYVALAGARYDRSIEVGQSVILERALQSLVALLPPVQPEPEVAPSHTARRRRARTTRRSTGSVAA